MARATKHREGEMCTLCQISPKRFKGYSVTGTPLFGADCNSCHKAKYTRPWLQHRGSSCEMCGYRPMFRGSLDVHHRDEDKENNEPENLMTVCASCHRELHGLIHEMDDYDKAESMLKRFLKAVLPEA